MEITLGVTQQDFCWVRETEEGREREDSTHRVRLCFCYGINGGLGCHGISLYW